MAKADSLVRRTASRQILLMPAAIILISAPSSASAQDGPIQQPNLTVPAAAASLASNDAGSDIVVTARRREERVQDVPIAIGVVSAKTIQDTGAYTLGQLQTLTPNLLIISFNPRNTNINIRGLGSNIALTNDGLENGVGVYVDQVYQGRVGLSQFELTDLERIEVLRGPQGTLFGKNTTAGAISITSRKPSFDWEGFGEASVGDYNFTQVKGSISGPIIKDVLAARISIAQTHHDGFVENVRTRQDAQDLNSFTARGQLLFEPDANIEVRLIGDYARQRQRCCINIIDGVFTTLTNGAPVTNGFYARAATLGYTPLPINPFARLTDADSPFYANMNQWGVSGQVDWKLDNALLTSITAYRNWNWHPANDADNIGLPINVVAQQVNHQKQFSQEIRLASTGDRRLDYVVGAYYFWQVVDGTGSFKYGSAAPSWYLPAAVPAAIGNAALNGFAAGSTSTPETTNIALFGQLSWKATDRLSLTGGLRYTHEKKRGAFDQSWTGGADLSLLAPAAAAAATGIRNGFNPVMSYSTAFTDDSISGLATASYKITPDALGYVTYSRGSKSGGLNLSNLPPGIDPIVRPESVNNYEAGVKTQWLDRALTANLSVFWTDVFNYQTAVTQTNDLGGTALQYIANIKHVRSRGVELDSSWALSRHWSVDASGSYTDARYVSYDNGQCPVEVSLTPAICSLTGQQLSGVAEWSGSAAVNGAQPIGKRLEAYGRVDVSARSGVYTAVSNSIYSRVPPYALANLRIGVRQLQPGWDLSFFVRNLFDKNYFQTISAANTGLVSGLTGDPRTVGGTLRWRF